MNENDNSIDTPGAATTIDEVVALGIRLNLARLREEELDDKEGDARRTPTRIGAGYFEEAAHHAADEADVLRSMIPFVKARSLTGAGVQIVAAISLVDVMADRFPQSERRVVDRDVRHLYRLLFSALGVVDGVADQKVAEVINHLVAPHIDPWTPVEERIAAVRDRC